MNDVKEYPISRCKVSGKIPHQTHKWVFVKNVKGYSNAMNEAARLQNNNKTGWQYRIWDNR